MSGRILDADTRKPIEGASVSLIQANDSSRTPYATITNEYGRYLLTGLKTETYRIYISFLGYQQQLWTTPISVTANLVQQPDIYLKRKYLELSQVEIIESRPPVSLKKDTTEFSASYYKTKEVSPVGDLLRKLPGLEIAADGSITYNGSPVKQILVDGRPYFGNDLKMASRNILAGMIEKVQLIDRKPSAEEMGTTGNPTPEKAINLTLKKDRYDGLNGLVSAGYGTDGRYASRATINRFNAQQQISLVAGANNVNSFDEDMGIAAGNDNTKVWNAGLNYNQELSPRISLSSSYRINGENTTVVTSSLRQNFLKDSSFDNRQTSTATSTATVHNGEIGLKLQLDSSSSLVLLNRLSFTLKSNLLENDFSTSNKSGLINTGHTDNQSNGNTLFYLTNWTYTKKFSQPGRILIAGFNYSHGSTPQKTFNRSETLFNLPAGEQLSDSLNQMADQHGINSIFQLTLNYAQPVFKDRFVDMAYIYTRFGNRTDRSVYGASFPKGPYDVRIDSLSADFRSLTVAQYGGLSFRTQKQKFDYSVGVGMIRNTLNSRIISTGSALQKNLLNVFPTASLNMDISRNWKLHFDYNRNIQPPGASQLQPVPDNSNPLLLQSGNPDLKPATQDYFNLGIRSFNPMSLLSLNFNASTGLLHNQIVTELQTDSMGRQISRPVNVNGAYFISLYAGAGIPLKKLKTSVNTSTSLSLNRDLSINNGLLSTADKMVLRQSLSFNYSHRELFELMAYLSLTYNTASYALQHNNYKYYDYAFSFNGNINLLLGFTLGANLNYTLLAGRAEGYNTDMLIINAMIAKSLLSGQRGQLKLQVFDLLDRNLSRQRNVGENFIEDSQTSPLRRFGMLSFTYYLKKR
ncbi:TonB-dependent receptor [Chitinophaga sp. CC14]|uniref:outer membrane beta-barrel protein n=1 Tax=Chitinophaga sp. CC14 TaxID=3029199 RepID=UPI003B81A0ED